MPRPISTVGFFPNTRRLFLLAVCGRVRPAVGGLEVGYGHVRVDLGGFEFSVAEYLLHVPQVEPVLHEHGSDAVTLFRTLSFPAPFLSYIQLHSLDTKEIETCSQNIQLGKKYSLLQRSQ